MGIATIELWQGIERRIEEIDFESSQVLHQHSFVVVCKLYCPIHIYACQQISLGYIQKAAVHPQSPMNKEYIKAKSWPSDMI